MTKDRLSGIWGGFASRSSLDLAGTSVDDTPRPSRVSREHAQTYGDQQMDLRQYPTPEASSDPVSAALSAMHQEMTTQAKSGGRRRAAAEPVVAHHSEPPASAVEQTLLADLAFTQSKTTRSGSDYIAYAAARQDEWQKRKRKKFLGIF